jgi:Flp pilus assembly protein TadD
MNPESTQALTALAKLTEVQKRPRESLEAWRALAAINDEEVDAHRGMGRSLMALGLYKKAIPEFERALQIGGKDDSKTMNLLAMAQLRDGDASSAIATLNEALEHNDDLVTRNNLGFTYIMAGENSKAIQVLEEVAKNPKSTAQQRQNLALAYGLAGRDEDARATALQDLPPDAVANNLKTYRMMREKISGHATPVYTKPLTAKEKKAAAKAAKGPKQIKVDTALAPAVKPEAKPVAAPAAPSPEAIPLGTGFDASFEAPERATPSKR